MAAPNVHRVEAARHVPSTATLARLAAALEVPLASLFEA
jgi:transcriptional regulator with XRE-family HTH domain